MYISKHVHQSFFMSKKPYYNHSSLPCHAKSAKSNCSSSYNFDLPAVKSNKFILPPNCLSVTTIEPYYQKRQKIQTLPPVLFNQYHYKFNEEEDCAISDTEDIDIEQSNILAKLSKIRKVSDAYATSLPFLDNVDDEVDPTFCKNSEIKDIPKCNRESVLNVDLVESEVNLQEKADNPNIITNPKSRSLSMLLSPVKCEYILNIGNLLVDVSIRQDISDFYDFKIVEYLV